MMDKLQKTMSLSSFTAEVDLHTIVKSLGDEKPVPPSNQDLANAMREAAEVLATSRNRGDVVELASGWHVSINPRRVKRRTVVFSVDVDVEQWQKFVPLYREAILEMWKRMDEEFEAHAYVAGPGPAIEDEFKATNGAVVRTLFGAWTP